MKPTETMFIKDLDQKSIAEIAGLIMGNWSRVYFGAVPYLNAMGSLNSVNDAYGLDSGKSVVNYFLANAATWRGPMARLIKNELKRRVK